MDILWLPRPMTGVLSTLAVLVAIYVTEEGEYIINR